MLAYIFGLVRSIDEAKTTLTPEGMGLGYEVLCPNSVLHSARIGEALELFLHHHITDVSEVLFGFPTPEERMIFRKLLKVDGVGGKTALSLLNLGTRQLVLAIETGDEKVLGSASGVGKKTALKIIVELKKELSSETLFAQESSQVPLAPAHHTEILDTLVGMGYEKKLVSSVLEHLPEDRETVSEQVIWAIRQLATK
jgi:Holliday junction DNA helicase RuvA